MTGTLTVRAAVSRVGAPSALEPEWGPPAGAVHLATELRRIRLRSGLSQREVVRRLGLSAHSNLVDYELGRRIPPGDIITACESLFELPKGYLQRLRCAALVERAETGDPPADPSARREDGTGPPPPDPDLPLDPHEAPARSLPDHRCTAGSPLVLPLGRRGGPDPPGCRLSHHDGCPPVVALPQPAGGARPMQLPAIVAGFTGRTRHLRQLDGLLAGSADGPARAVVIGAITGPPGAGKTALAVCWAHRVRERFPDGQLYADLRGYASGAPLTATAALARFLRALGEPAPLVAADVAEAAGQYRSLLADKRMLVVLDNARTAEQVRPLVPGGPGCLLLVTSRNRLDGLVAREGARRVTADPLALDEAILLLARVLGEEWVAARPRAAAALVQACGRLPLAVRIAATKLAGRPASEIGSVVAQLTSGNRMAALHLDDDEQSGVRAAFDLSYRVLTADARRLLRRLGSSADPEITPAAAGALVGTTVDAAARSLDRLARESLVTPAGQGRYALPDLLRGYSAGLPSDQALD